jgi:hypothetical protein
MLGLLLGLVLTLIHTIITQMGDDANVRNSQN